MGPLCDEPSAPGAWLARRAAIEPGAHVSLVRPGCSGGRETAPVHDLVHLLGRLYDLLVCIALDPALVDMLREVAVAVHCAGRVRGHLYWSAARPRLQNGAWPP